jgi:hypothetical protein
MEQLMALGTVLGDQYYTTKACADLKAKLEKEKAAWETTQIKVDTLTQAVESLKILANNFAS